MTRFRITPTGLYGCPAPAKLNLFLHVTGRRADGYHMLQTVFQLIDRCDTLDVEVRADGQILRQNEVAGVPAESDLIVRAARLLQQHTGCRQGAALRLNKCLPMGGGLGGGSSDAASTLIALNYLWQTGLSQQQLMELGVQLGADIPFFIFGRNAFAEGIGEQLQEITTPDCWYVVIEPGVQVPTPAIFSSPLLTRNTPPVIMSVFPSNAANNWRNDLQTVACALFPEVEEAVNWLSQFGNAKMTGSGACVFCAFPDEESAAEVAKQAQKRWTSWNARSLKQHPLLELLQK